MKLQYSLNELEQVAKQLIAQSKYKTWLFHAPMGAGKTTLIKALAGTLGVKEMTSSPTFSVVNEYSGTDGAVLFHFDLYRLKGDAEALDMGLDEYFDQNAWCFVEWPDQAAGILPEDVHILSISILDEYTRALKFE